jgi:hypothetical protein
MLSAAQYQHRASQSASDRLDGGCRLPGRRKILDSAAIALVSGYWCLKAVWDFYPGTTDRHPEPVEG